MTTPAATDDTDARGLALAQLLQALHGQQFTAEIVQDVVRVSREDGTGVDIRCAPRGSDGGRMWFFAGEGEPLAPADQLFEAIPAIKGLTAPRLP